MNSIKIDDLAAEIMQGLTEYSDLAEQEMEKAVRKTARSVKAEIMLKAPKKTVEQADLCGVAALGGITGAQALRRPLRRSRIGRHSRERRHCADWRASQVEKTSRKIRLVIHSPKHYSRVHLLEKGHAKRNGGRVEGIPHVAPAEQHGEEILEQLIKKALQ